MNSWLISLFGNAFNNIWSLSAGIILARWLPPETRGIVAQILFWVQTFILISYMSMNERIVFNNYSKKTYAFSLKAFPFLYCLFIVCIILFAQTQDKVNTPVYYLYGVFFFVIYYAKTILYTCLYKVKKYNYVVASNGVYGACYLITLGTIVIVIQDLTIGYAVLASFIGEISSFIYIYISCVRCNISLKKEIILPKFNRNNLSDLIKTTFVNHIVFVLSIISKNIDRIIIYILFSGDIIGYYVVASAIPNVLIQLFSRASQDIIVTKSADNSLSHKNFLLILMFGVLFNICAIVFIFLFGKQVLLFVFGENYILSFSLLVPLIIYSSSFTLKDMISKFLKCRNMKYSFIIEFVSVFLSVFFVFLLTQYNYLNIELVINVLAGVNILTIFLASYLLFKKEI